MKGFLGSFLMLLTAAMATACLSTTASPPENMVPATAVTPALKTVPTKTPSGLESAQPRAATPLPHSLYPPDGSYPGPATMPPRSEPYPPGNIRTTPVPSEVDIFLMTRAAELGVQELQGEQRKGALQLYTWQKLSEREMGYLRLAWDPILELRPGESHHFSVGLNTSIFNDFPLVDKQVSWSISPTDGATIDPQTGLFTVDEETPPGTVYTVKADVENGRASPTIEVYVYTPEAYPLVGRWHEEKQFSCTGEDVVVKENDKIGGLRFFADGTFMAPMPFETYTVYRGTYRYDKASGELSMTIESGAYIPADFDGSGLATLDTPWRLVLMDLWLGSSQRGKSGTNCGHVFVRYES